MSSAAADFLTGLAGASDGGMDEMLQRLAMMVVNDDSDALMDSNEALTRAIVTIVPPIVDEVAAATASDETIEELATVLAMLVEDRPPVADALLALPAWLPILERRPQVAVALADALMRNASAPALAALVPLLLDGHHLLVDDAASLELFALACLELGTNEHVDDRSAAAARCLDAPHLFASALDLAYRLRLASDTPAEHLHMAVQALYTCLGREAVHARVDAMGSAVVLAWFATQCA